ncbi:hypothetical protein JOC75_002842 [Metabacillus crassostreae]|uniref:hypothetical protein n=1 Tax=Metabacillus crassostreae TaxID=929098 RepID=UPI00195A2359|nr:hypothetical protein [Metabacillus crassostreae]MBM7604838.1 hypothetical protein [Metabacillus crassostreae]
MKEKTIGLMIAIVVMTLMSFVFMGLDIPFPSTYLALMITTNAIVAFISIILQKATIVIYEGNVNKEKNSISDYVFSYIAIGFSGINYYVQKVLNRLPFLLNKLLAITFFLIIFFQLFMIADIY